MRHSKDSYIQILIHRRENASIKCVCEIKGGQKHDKEQEKIIIIVDYVVILIKPIV